MSQPSDHNISLEKAVELVTAFHKQLPSLVQPDFKDALPFSETFSKSAFESLISQKRCAGIRAYLGLDESNQVRLIFVATDDKNQDILPSTDDAASILEYGQRCPPICSVSPLNPEI